MKKLILLIAYLHIWGILGVFAGNKLPISAIPTETLSYMKENYSQASEVE